MLRKYLRQLHWKNRGSQGGSMEVNADLIMWPPPEMLPVVKTALLITLKFLINLRGLIYSGDTTSFVFTLNHFHPPLVRFSCSDFLTCVSVSEMPFILLTTTHPFKLQVKSHLHREDFWLHPNLNQILVCILSLHHSNSFHSMQ